LSDGDYCGRRVRNIYAYLNISKVLFKLPTTGKQLMLITKLMSVRLSFGNANIKIYI
jgi:hypothetical protein